MLEKRIIAFTGYSNSGKTTLIRKVLEKLSSNYRIAVIKHHGHTGNKKSTGELKDTVYFKKSGAVEVDLIIGTDSLESAINNLTEKDIDLIILEGFKNKEFPKFFLKRENTRSMEFNLDNLIGIISDNKNDKIDGLIWFNIDDIENIVNLIKNRFLKGD